MYKKEALASVFLFILFFSCSKEDDLSVPDTIDNTVCHILEVKQKVIIVTQGIAYDTTLIIPYEYNSNNQLLGRKLGDYTKDSISYINNEPDKIFRVENGRVSYPLHPSRPSNLRCKRSNNSSSTNKSKPPVAKSS